MRMWVASTPSEHVITDEQLLAYVASAGSLSEALKSGDVTLLCETEADGRRVGRDGESQRKRRRLADYLRDC